MYIYTKHPDRKSAKTTWIKVSRVQPHIITEETITTPSHVYQVVYT